MLIRDDKNIFLRRIQRMRWRQFAIAGVSVTTALFAIVVVRISEVGDFSYYSIILLLVANAMLALMQIQRVIKPVASLLQRLQNLARDIDERGFSAHIGHLDRRADSTFSCLAAGIDEVMEHVLERARTVETLLRRYSDTLSAVPIDMVILSRKMSVLHIVNQLPNGTKVEGFETGEPPLVAFWGADNIKLMTDNLFQTFETGEMKWLDFNVDAGPGGQRHYRGTLKRMNDISALMTVVDMTEVERTCTARQQAKLAQADTQRRTALRHMASSVAHDTRNVFAALLNLAECYRDSPKPEVQESLKMADDAIKRGLGLMNELMDYAGEMRFSLECVHTQAFLEKAASDTTLRALCPPTIEFFPLISKEEMPDIDIDSRQFWKIPFNLTKNSAEAMRQGGGRIWMKAEPFAMTEELAGRFRHSGKLRLGPGVLLSFIDDGPGMPTAVLEHLFEPYFTTKSEGRGIGLPTIMTIVDGHGGAMNVQSRLGQGTSFYIWLPASRHSADELELMRKVAPNGEVLLVDDDPTILHTTSLVLRTLKIAAHPASSREDALVKMRSLRSRIKAVVMDAHLGGTDATDLLAILRQEYPKTPVIVTSGATEEDVRKLFPEGSFGQFLAKPYSVQDFATAFNAVTKTEEGAK